MCLFVRAMASIGVFHKVAHDDPAWTHPSSSLNQSGWLIYEKHQQGQSCQIHELKMSSYNLYINNKHHRGWYGCFQKQGENPQLKNRGFHYFHHPFWGFSPYLWKHPYGDDFLRDTDWYQLHPVMFQVTREAELEPVNHDKTRWLETTATTHNVVAWEISKAAKVCEDMPILFEKYENLVRLSETTNTLFAIKL